MHETPAAAREVKQEDAYSHKFRDEDPKRFLGNALFIIKGFKNEADRIEQAVKDYAGSPGYQLHKKVGDGSVVADSNKHEFRERNVMLEIQPEMKFGLSQFKGSQAKGESVAGRREGQVGRSDAAASGEVDSGDGGGETRAGRRARRMATPTSRRRRTSRV